MGTLTKTAKLMTASRAKKMPTKIMMRPAARFLPTTPRPAMMPLKKGGLFRQQAAPWQHKGKSAVSVYIYIYISCIIIMKHNVTVQKHKDLTTIKK